MNPIDLQRNLNRKLSPLEVFLGLAAMCAVLSASACTVVRDPVGHFTMISTKTVEFSHASLTQKDASAVKGEHCEVQFGIFGGFRPLLAAAVEDALNKSGSTVLIDADVMYTEKKYPVISQQCIELEARGARIQLSKAG